MATGQDMRSPGDDVAPVLFVRMPPQLKSDLTQEALLYSVRARRVVPVSEYVRMVLDAHVHHTPCPCSAHCAGG